MIESLSSRRLMRVLTALLHIAANEKPLSGRALSERMQCPRRYLEADLQRLAKAGILESQRGAGGGYSLAMNPARISLYEVIQCLGDEQMMMGEDGCALLMDVVQPGLQALMGEFQQRLSDLCLSEWLQRAEELGLVSAKRPTADFSI